MLSDLTVKGFISELSSNSPAPGGGSVAALGASIGAALSAMVFSLTVGKKAYNNYDEETKKLIDESLVKANDLKSKYLQLMEDDTEAFLKVMKAFKMPKETEEEKKIRKQKIDESYKGALDVPCNLANLCYEAYDVIDVAINYGNVNAISDAGVAALFIQASLESAILNVKINLSSVSDEEKQKMIKEKCNELITKGRDRRDSIVKIANEKIEG